MSPRRRRLPEHLEGPATAFDDLLPPLGRAEAALTGSVPGTRVPGRPLAETLSEFEEGLREVRDGMEAWRSPDIEPEWRPVRRVSTRRSHSPTVCGPRVPNPMLSRG